MKLLDAKTKLDSAGFWCSFSDRKRTLKVYWDGEYVARLHGVAEEPDVNRLILWARGTMSGA